MQTVQPTDDYPIIIKYTKPKTHPTQKMVAIEWHGDQDMRVVERPKVMITEPKDCVVRITTTTICGSDLHLYHKEFAGLEKEDVLGHECMGIVDDIGPEVRDLKVGDRVVVSAVICCGECNYCKRGEISLCNHTNPSKELESMYGYRLSGIFGYSHLLGGYDGGQAEYIRVPLADRTCLKVPDTLKDEQVLFLSDIVCTGWHANELAEVKQGDVVAIWGSGPVGLMAQMWAKFRGASRVIAIDNIPNRLAVSEKLGCEVINFEQTDPVNELKRRVKGGPDVCIEAVGFRFPKSLIHKVERFARLETDSPQVLTECILACKKGGRMAVVGDYYAYCNHFPIGPLMEKYITFRGSQVFVQKYWKELLGYIEQGKVDPTFVVTHTMSLREGDKAYRMFDRKEDNCLKILLKPDFKPNTV
jgi:threonine dehydrogenase-like Zn-dependent dehydrogenase